MEPKRGEVFCRINDFGELWGYDNKLHRDDGPAQEWENETKFWWLNGERVPCSSQEEFEQYKRLKAFW